MEIKPCPFCGEVPEVTWIIQAIPEDRWAKYFICCGAEKCHMTAVYVKGLTVKSCINKWNKRKVLT